MTLREQYAVAETRAVFEHRGSHAASVAASAMSPLSTAHSMPLE